MKNMLILAAFGFAAAGCTGTTCDTGDSSCKGGDDTNGTVAPLLQFVDANCSGSTCTYDALADGVLGGVDLYLAETGDPTSTCGPGKSLSECGFWEETHTAFVYSGDNSYGGETWSLSLDLEPDYTQQVDNTSTIFDLNSATISAQLTLAWVIYDSAGAYADCAVYGEDISYFANVCTNSWN